MPRIWSAFSLLLLALVICSCGEDETAIEEADTTRPEVEIGVLIQKAEQGDAFAQFGLALRYEEGDGVPQDAQESLRWLRLAAEGGEPGAQFYLGMAFRNGEGVMRDDAEAVKWWRLSAEQGFQAAQLDLGAMYANGEGVARSDLEAYKWFVLASIQEGYTDDYLARAPEYRDRLGRRMTNEEIAQAELLAAQWLEKHEERSQQ